jgi:hypothetical protein
LGFGPKLRVQSGFWEGAWAKVSRFQGFKVSRFQGFRVSRFQRFKEFKSSSLRSEVEFLQSPALFERFETLKL